MPSNLSDDVVTEILKREAAKHGKDRLTGNNSFLFSPRPRPEGPKPNTKFLRNLIRDTDSHNAALLAKEREDSRARRRREVESVRDDSRDRQSRDYRREGGHHGDRRSHKRRRSRSSDYYDRSSRKHAKSTRRFRSPARGDISGLSEKTSSARNSPSSRLSRRVQDPKEEAHSASDSDPLAEHILGPLPSSRNRIRGRGAQSSSGVGIDHRFAEAYDPQRDVESNSDDNNAAKIYGPKRESEWDAALEAYRDRSKLKSKHAERLLEAGFTPTEVEQWQTRQKTNHTSTQGIEGDIADVKWTKRGEAREWDRGKVSDGGRIDVKAAWVRGGEGT